MAVTIRPLGMLKSYIGGKSETAVDAGGTVRKVLQDLGIPPEVVALVLVDDEQQSKEYVLRDGETVKLMAIIGGGTR